MGKIIFFLSKEVRPMLKVLNVAQYFLSLGSMKHKKLQKLCYYAQSWYLVLTGKRLMDTVFEAWVHGPVSPELYVYYRDWGGLTIPQMPYTSKKIDEKTKNFLQLIYSMYKEYSADDLEKLTHQEQPWKEAREGYPADSICRVRIKEETMKQYYEGLLSNGK